MGIVLCSNCFIDQGLRLDAERIGDEDGSACPNCGNTSGRKLTVQKALALAHRFFVWGTLHRCDYGAAPVVQFNEHQKTDINTSPWHENDVELLGNTLGIGFFYYGPRLWMVGEVEPLKDLQKEQTRSEVIQRIISDYPDVYLYESQLFFRIRKSPENPSDFGEYDSPPNEFLATGRLDSTDLPVMYASQDLEICLHECRVTAEDELYVATLRPTRRLRLLDISRLLPEEKVTEFESLDMAIHMLFLAGEHLYRISRGIARSAHEAGYDGIVYSSYFSLLRTGTMPFVTTYGISHRRLPGMRKYEESKSIPNFALFGRPLHEKKVSVRCINRLILRHVTYDFHFGPVGY